MGGAQSNSDGEAPRAPTGTPQPIPTAGGEPASRGGIYKQRNSNGPGVIFDINGVATKRVHTAGAVADGPGTLMQHLLNITRHRWNTICFRQFAGTKCS